jgi:hypothetical protein
MLGPERPEAVSPERGVVLTDLQSSIDCQSGQSIYFITTTPEKNITCRSSPPSRSSLHTYHVIVPPPAPHPATHAYLVPIVTPISNTGEGATNRQVPLASRPYASHELEISRKKAAGAMRL